MASVAIEPCPDAFVTRIRARGDEIIFSTYLGGSDVDRAQAVAADGAGNVVVTGQSYSSEFPPFHALQAAHAGAGCQSTAIGAASLDAAVPCSDAIVLITRATPFFAGFSWSPSFLGVPLLPPDNAGNPTGSSYLGVVYDTPAPTPTPTTAATAIPTKASKKTATAVPPAAKANKCKKGYKRFNGKYKRKKKPAKRPAPLVRPMVIVRGE